MSDRSRSAVAGAARPKVVLERTYRARLQELWDLWTTKDGFESWWGPDGFRVDVHAIDPRVSGTLHYDMIADSPQAIEAMTEIGRPSTLGFTSQLAKLDKRFGA
jgi:uncharacterized protein YndB with AHSA1/START domain